jgi:mono/diheme cytochrome c family protein
MRERARLRTVLSTVAACVVIAVIAAVAFVYSGVYDVGATAPHWSLTSRLVAAVRDRSIDVRAASISVPANLDDPDKILMGVDHFAAHCAECHGAPGVPKGDIARGLYPAAPNLADPGIDHRPARLFWILKNGLKMTGMPAWPDHSDEELWATVAFLQKLPGMSDADYAKLIMANMTRGGHRHADHDAP